MKAIKSIAICLALSACGYANTIQFPVSKYPGIVEYGQRNGRRMAYDKAKQICGNKRMIVVSDSQTSSSFMPVYNGYTKNTTYIAVNQFQLRFVCESISY